MGLAIGSSVAVADEPTDARSQLFEAMHAWAQGTDVRVGENLADTAQLCEQPIFRYDDQPRRLIDATLWAYTSGGRPAAFLKVEAMDRGPAKWGFCFAATGDQKLSAKWPERPEFQLQGAATAYAPMPHAAVPADRGGERKRQLRRLSREFSAKIIKDRVQTDVETMRMLSTPLMEYSAGDSNLPCGGVFGFASNGTNPDLLLILEVRDSAAGPAWHFAPVRMTDGGVTLNHQKTRVWETAFLGGELPPFETWTYFEAPRTGASAP